SNRRHIDARVKTAAQNGTASRLRHPPMQFDDESTIILVLRRHQRRRLPAGREDGEPSAVILSEIGAESPCLHWYRTIRQADARDVGIVPKAAATADAPRQPPLRQFELMGRAYQRGLVGVALTGLFRQIRRHGRSAATLWLTPILNTRRMPRKMPL